MARNYKQETGYEDTPKQVKRRESRNTARRRAAKAGRVRKGDGLEVDHLGYHLSGTLRNVPVRVVSQHANRVRQPPTKARRR